MHPLLAAWRWFVDLVWFEAPAAPPTAPDVPAPIEPRAPPARTFDDDQRRARAAHARVLSSDPLLVEAFSSLERTYIAAWRLTASHQTGERERLWDAVSVLRTVQLHLETVAADGALLEQQVQAVQRLSTTALRA